MNVVIKWDLQIDDCLSRHEGLNQERVVQIQLGSKVIISKTHRDYICLLRCYDFDCDAEK
jgi:hypothetical protein